MTKVSSDDTNSHVELADQITSDFTAADALSAIQQATQQMILQVMRIKKKL